MDRGYSAFCQLTSAWQPVLLCAGGIGRAIDLPGASGATLAADMAAVAPATPARPAHPNPRVSNPRKFSGGRESAPSVTRRASAAEAPRVVVIKSALRPAQPLECHRAESSRFEGRVYRVDSLSASNLGCLEQFHVAHAPRVLVVDVALISLVTADTLRQHRRRMPATDLLLASDASCPADRSLIVRSQARGCVDWSIGSVQLARALDAVLAGEIWFSRSTLQDLYLAFLGAGPERLTPRGAAVEHDALTAREVEVLGCMRHGMTNKQIAERLGISVNTVKKHLAHVYEKRGLHNGRQMVV